MYKLKMISHEEHLQILRGELVFGLKKAVERRCDAINEFTSGMGYLGHMWVQENLSEIMELIELDERKRAEAGAGTDDGRG